MAEKISSAQDIVERLSASYRVNTQKALSEKLDVPSNNVSAWVQRNSVPGNAIVKCVLDTGADIHWLVSGEFANASFEVDDNSPKGKQLYDLMQLSGGKPLVRRVLDAYGFRTQKELSDHLNISSGTISTWIRREFFPGDVVICCALDTGVSLEWLATGNHKPASSQPSAYAVDDSLLKIKRKLLIAGQLESASDITLDRAFIPADASEDKLCYVSSGKSAWLVVMENIDVSNGMFLLDIDGALDVYKVSRRPGNKILVSGRDNDFECAVSDVKAVGIVVSVINQMI